MKIRFKFINRTIIAAFLLAASCALVFSESEEEKKRKILEGADLSGISAEELMSGDDEEYKSGGNEARRLPSEFPRDVPYTKAALDFCEAHYNHQIFSDEARKRYYDASVQAAENLDEYSKLVCLARAEYYYGLSVMETFDFTSLENVDLGGADGAVTKEEMNKIAGNYFDKSIEYAEAALEIKKGSDAYSMLSQAISMNCTTKTMSYILGNGLKVRSNARKAVKKDYSNGTAQYLVIAQDAYAPWPFGKPRTGRNKLIALLDDKYVRIEKADKQMILSAIGYTFFKQKKWDKAIEWYKKLLEVYPNNYVAKNMMKKCQDKKAGKK